MPTISVIVPVFNGARFVPDALASICAQTLLPIEIIVADDVSTDNTREVVAEFAKTAPVPINLFTMEKNTGGPYGPASQAFKRTKGEYVCILDVDDMFAPDAFATYMRMFADGPDDIGLATSDFVMFEDGTGKLVVPSYFAQRPKLLEQIIADQSDVGVVLEQSDAIHILAHAFAIPFKGMLSRQAWLELGGPNLEFGHICDVDFVWRLANRSDFRIRVSNRPLVRVRSWPGSMSSNSLRLATELVRLYRTMLKETDDQDLAEVIRQRLDRELFDLSYVAYKQRDFAKLAAAMWSLSMGRLRRKFRRDKCKTT